MRLEYWLALDDPGFEYGFIVNRRFRELRIWEATRFANVAETA